MSDLGPLPVYGLLGHPLHHTLSPRLHEAALAACSLPGRYVALPVAAEALADAVRGARAFHFAGLNVTVPHKVAVMPLLDDVTQLARRIGAVNTLYWEGDRLVGDNTDLGGFLASLPADAPTGGEALLLGAGGAARAVALALVERGVDALHVVARQERGAAEFRDALVSGLPGEAVSLSDVPGLVERAPHCRLVINATPVGSHGEGCPITPEVMEALPADALVIDLVYRPQATTLVRRAQRRGLRAIDGREMLVCQAALSFALWTGIDPPREVMRAAAALDAGEGSP